MLKASKHNSSIIHAENSRGDFMPNLNETESKVQYYIVMFRLVNSHVAFLMLKEIILDRLSQMIDKVIY